MRACVVDRLPDAADCLRGVVNGCSSWASAMRRRGRAERVSGPSGFSGRGVARSSDSPEGRRPHGNADR